MSGSSDALLASLQAGAVRFARLDPRGRAELARRTAMAVVAAADRWVDVAVAIKSPGRIPGAEVRAEETATGPVPSLRLLLVTARCLGEIGARGVPRPAAPPRSVAHGVAASVVAVDVVPEPWLADRAMFAGHRGTVLCDGVDDLASFRERWLAECRERPRQGGVAVVLAAGNVTGLSVADAISQIFERGRAALVKLHPLHAPLLPVFRDALGPLVDAGMLALVAGGPELVQDTLGSPTVCHVHLTGGRAAFDAIVWGADGPRGGSPVLTTPITCELGGVTPWIVVPGRYTAAQLRCQADLVAGSILNNTSFNCIATKCVVTSRTWGQRDAFLDLVARRLAAAACRPAWYPGSAATWAEVTQRQPPADGTLPWVLRTAVDPTREPRWLEREWFAPVAVETPLDADGMEGFCDKACDFVRSLPGTLACSVTIPAGLPPHDARSVELLVDLSLIHI